MPEHTLRILHMSDLHERVELPSMDDVRKAKIRGMKAGRYRVFESNLTEVLQEIAGDGEVDLLCFTGDVADWGREHGARARGARGGGIVFGAADEVGVAPTRGGGVAAW